MITHFLITFLVWALMLGSALLGLGLAYSVLTGLGLKFILWVAAGALLLALVDAYHYVNDPDYHFE